MTQAESMLLGILKATLEDKEYLIKPDTEDSTILDVLHMSEAHGILPIIFEAICNKIGQRSDAFSERYEDYRDKAVKSVATQIEKTALFLQRYDAMRSQGFTPLVVKGLVCRQLYSRPDYRGSTDEDILIPPDQFSRLVEYLQSHGMEYLDQVDEEKDYSEISMANAPEYIEVHKCLFDEKSEIFGRFNTYFQGIHDSVSTVYVQDYGILTPEPTYHLLFLILHAFKHFIYHGFGVRQMCDITLFCNEFGSSINWDVIREKCHDAHAYDFASAIFKIGEKYLTFDHEKACIPKMWDYRSIDETPLLADCLEAGLLGVNDMNRIHSATLSLTEMMIPKNGINSGKKKRFGLLKSLFPSRDYMGRQYDYLEKMPFLLPLAWSQRLLRYTLGMMKKQQDDPKEILRIAKERRKLFHKYNII